MHQRRPYPLVRSQVARLIGAAPSLTDKLLIGLLTGTNLSLTQTLSLRWMDFDITRRTVLDTVWPAALVPLVERLVTGARPAAYVFAQSAPRRHLSPRDAERRVRVASRIAQMPEATAATLDQTDPRMLGAEVMGLLDAACVPPPPTRPNVRGTGLRLRATLTSEVLGRAKATLQVSTKYAHVELAGITVDGSMNPIIVRVPVVEAWRLPLSELTPKDRARLARPDFFRLLAFELAERFARERARAMLSGRHGGGGVGRYAERGDHRPGAAGR